jgi:hypothetical protein
VILSAPEVDVIKDWLDYTNLAFGTLGVGATIAALIFAGRAQGDAKKARLSVSLERRRQFELEILRSFMEDLDEDGLHQVVVDKPGILRRYESRLRLLPEKDLPFWRQLVGLSWRDEVSALVGFKDVIQKASQDYNTYVATATAGGRSLSELSVAESLQMQILAEEMTVVNRRFEGAVRDRLVVELLDAIKVRVEAVDD